MIVLYRAIIILRCAEYNAFTIIVSELHPIELQSIIFIVHVNNFHHLTPDKPDENNTAYKYTHASNTSIPIQVEVPGCRATPYYFYWLGSSKFTQP